MSLTTRVGLLAGACTLTLTGAGYADNTTEAQDYEARIAELEARVAQLTGNDWMTESRADGHHEARLRSRHHPRP